MFIDIIFFEFVHFLYEIAGVFFTPFFRLITILGEKGWFFLVIASILALRKETRWVGATIILSIFFSFVLSDAVLKPLIARPRPYQSDMANIYKYWVDAGSIEEKGFSMPSGHTLAVASFFFSLLITVKKSNRKMIFSYGVFGILLMILSRCYFMHHHLTDCLLSVVIAFFMAYIGKFVARLVYIICKNNKNIGLFNFIVNFDFFELFAPRRR